MSFSSRGDEGGIPAHDDEGGIPARNDEDVRDDEDVRESGGRGDEGGGRDAGARDEGGRGDEDGIPARKASHMQICTDARTYQIEGDGEGTGKGFGALRLVPNALPELHADDVDCGVDFLGYRLALPLMISPMSGGSERKREFNHLVATVAQRCGLACGLGSMRVLFRHPDMEKQFAIKETAADVPVIANIGGAQLIAGAQRSGEAGGGRRERAHGAGETLDDIIRLCERLRVDALSVHLNCGQELFQPDGDRDFVGMRAALERLVKVSPYPVIVKETGFGIAPTEIDALIACGVRYVDVAGSGGTNWIRVEAYRHGEENDDEGCCCASGAQGAEAEANGGRCLCDNDEGEAKGERCSCDNGEGCCCGHGEGKEANGEQCSCDNGEGCSCQNDEGCSCGNGARGTDSAERRLYPNAELFHDWGLSTAVILAALREAPRAQGSCIIASGGIRNAMHIAKCMALGANLTAMALPFARLISSYGVESTIEFTEQIKRDLTAIMLLCGAKDIEALRGAAIILDSELSNAAGQLARGRRRTSAM